MDGIPSEAALPVRESGLRAGTALADAAYTRLKKRAIFECCKWDPQVGDTPTLASFPLWLSPATWASLAGNAERLHAEVLEAERALVDRGELLRELGLPWAIRRALSSSWRLRSMAPLSSGVARFMRFDFHPTTEGWRISEVNCDVPGGFLEASGVGALMAEACGGACVGDPAGALVAALREHGRTIALVHATAYADDRQQMEYLARRFSAIGVDARMCAPDTLGDDVDALLRFFPAEWLPNLPRAAKWRRFFRGAPFVAANPGSAIIVQSKRFPLVWDRLDVALPAWRALLPETRDPRAVSAQELASGAWVLKPALGRVGEGVVVRGAVTIDEERAIARAARRSPRHFVAQRRFEALPLSCGDAGLRYPCIGVFTVDGKAAGAYGRVARVPLIDHRAQDAAVLLEQP